jgi:pyruvate/2-oxoacid:ferredoxin oxidoreductase alpha subunit
MPFEVPEPSKVDELLLPYRPPYALDPANPANLNTVTLPDVRFDSKGKLAHGYMEIRYLLQEDLMKAIDAMARIDERFREQFGRGGYPYYETYRCEDAEFTAVSMGSLSYHLRDVVDMLRADGIKVGIMSVHLYRPFPAEAIADALIDSAGVIVFEKALSYGYEGALCSDIKSALYHHGACGARLPFVHNYILGLGGREIRTVDLADALKNSCMEGGTSSDALRWIGLKI